MKRTLALLLAALLMVGLFAGCGGGGQKLPEDKVFIPLPDVLMPSDTSMQIDGSSGYYEKEESLEDVKAFYQNAFEELGAELIAELDAEQLKGIVPEPEQNPEGEPDNSENSIIWVMLGQYKAEAPKDKNDKNGESETAAPKMEDRYVIVSVAQKDDTMGVLSAVGARAEIIATRYGMISAESENAGK